jgi:hypothetical protein
MPGQSVIKQFMPWIILVGVIILYSTTLSPYVHLEDDGAFITSAFFNGTAHPPGYPLYTLISHFFTRIDISTIAARVHFVSVVFGAITISLIYAIIHQLTGRVLAAAISCLVLAFSEQFWSQSIIAEVYVLNTAIFFAIFYVLLKMQVDQPFGQQAIFPSIKYHLMIAAFLYGLGLCNHWPLLVLSSVGLLVLVLPYWRSLLRNLPILAGLLILGLTPYVWMYYFGSNKNDFIAFGDINNLQELVYYISREGYRNVDQSTAAGWVDKLSFLKFFIEESIRQFSLPLLSGILAGMIILLQRNLLVGLALITILAGNTVLLVLVLGFDYDGFHRILFMPYPLIAYGVLSIFLGIALAFIIEKVSATRLAWPVYLLLAILPIISLVKNYPAQNRSHDAWAEDFSTIILNILPPNAILFVGNDFYTGSMAYVHHVKKLRPDITLYQADGALYPNRLFHPYRNTSAEKKQRLNEFIAAEKRPVYTIDYLGTDLPQESMGVLSKINNSPDISGIDAVNQLIETQLYIHKKNIGWIELHKLTLAKNLLRFYQSQLPANRLALLTSHFEAQVTFLDMLVAQSEYLPRSYFEQLLKVMDNNANDFLLKETRANYLYLKAMVYIKVYLQPAASIHLLEESVKLNPAENNKAIKLLLEWYVEQHQPEKIIKLSKLTGIHFKY